eukprot:gene12530-6352_t
MLHHIPNGNYSKEKNKENPISEFYTTHPHYKFEILSFFYDYLKTNNFQSIMNYLGDSLSKNEIKEAVLSEYYNKKYIINDFTMLFEGIEKSKSDILEKFGEVVSKNESIQRLSIFRSKIGPAFTHFTRNFKNTHSIIELDFSNIEMNDESMKYLGITFQKNNVLLSLNVSNNKLTKDSDEHLGDLLKFNTTLEYLDVSFNELGHSDSQKFMNALKTNSSLTTLNLQNVVLSNADLTILGEALLVNKSLKNLTYEMRENSQESIDYLADCLERNSTLKSLSTDFYGNAIRFVDRLWWNSSITAIQTGIYCPTNRKLIIKNKKIEKLKMKRYKEIFECTSFGCCNKIYFGLSSPE